MAEVICDEILPEQEGMLADKYLQFFDLQNHASSLATWVPFHPRRCKLPQIKIGITTSTVGEFANPKNSWAVSPASMTEEDFVSSEDDKVQRFIFNLKNLKAIPFRIKMADRILELLRYAKEENSDSSGIKFDSLKQFINFFRFNTNLKYPSISLTADNEIYIRWGDRNKGLFSVVFLQEGGVQFVIFMPNKKHPDKKIRLSGVATVDTLFDIVPYQQIQSWIANER